MLNLEIPMITFNITLDYHDTELYYIFSKHRVMTNKFNSAIENYLLKEFYG